MQRRPFYLCSPFLLLFAFLSAAYGNVISIETQIKTTTRTDGTVDVAVAIKNKGDESAQSVYVETRSSNTVATSPIQSSLPVDKRFTFVSRHSLKDLLPGAYPLRVDTHYTDGNGYKFSALTVSILRKKASARQDILGILENMKLHKEGRISLRVKNAGETSKQFQVRLLTPIEITAEPGFIQSSLSSQEETRFIFALRNFSALPGSSYIVNSVIEYDEEGMHYTSLAPATIEIISEDPFLQRTSTKIGLAGIILIAALMGVRLFLEKRRRR